MMRIGEQLGHIMKKENVIMISIAVCISVIYLMAAFSRQYYVLDWFTTDDAFYYFKIADNITRGLGSTFDGISSTNGYHPLWMIILIPIFFFSKINLIFPLRLIILLQMVFSLISFIIIFEFLKKHLSIFTTAIVSTGWLLLPKIFGVATNGTESALSMMLLTILFVKTSEVALDIQGQEKMRKQAVTLGIWSALLMFARLDYVFLIVALGLWLGLVYFQSLGWNLANIKELVVFGLYYAMIPAASLGLYLLFNQILIGTAMPLSGQIKKYWGTLSMTVYGSRIHGKGAFLAEFLAPNSDIGPWNLILEPFNNLLGSYKVAYLFGTKDVFLGPFLLAFLAFLFGVITASNWDLFREKSQKWPLVPLLVGCLIQISYYKISGSLAQRSWYWVSEAFFMILVLGLLTEGFFRLVGRVSGRMKTAINAGISLIVVFGVIFSHAGISYNRVTKDPVDEHYYLDRTTWLQEHTQPGAVIGMTGAGNSGYFIEDRLIINLDGLVNGVDYFSALQNNSAGDYLVENDVQFIFGSDYIFLETDPYRSNFAEIILVSKELAKYDELTLWELDFDTFR